MEREELRIEISADAKQAIKEIAGASGAFLTLANTGKTSVAVLNDALAELRTARNNTFDATKISQFNKAIRELEFSAKGLKDIGIRSDVGENARRARVAIYGLNQVVRDLPFGFIAISNNIPILLDQFQALVREQKSVSKAFVEFGKGLLSGAGISLAISAVISLVTQLSVAYGGLGNAIRSITGNIDAAAVIQEKYNEAFAAGFGNVANAANSLRIFSDMAGDASVGTENQAFAVKALNEQLEKMVPAFAKAHTNLKGLDEAQEKYVLGAITAQIVIKAYAGVVDDLAKKYAEAEQNGVSFWDKVGAAFTTFAARGQATPGGTGQGPAGIGVNFTDEANKNRKKRIDDAYDALQKAMKQGRDKVNEFLKTYKAEDLFPGAAGSDGAKKIKDAYDELLKAQIANLQALITQSSQFGQTRLALMKDLAFKEKQLADNEARRNIQDQKAMLLQLETNLIDYNNKVSAIPLIPIASVDYGKLGRDAAERYAKAFKEGLKKDQITLEDLGMDPEKFKKIKVPDWITKWNEDARSQAAQTAAAYKKMQEETAAAIESLGSVFDDLTTGVLEDFLTKGKQGFETLIQNVGRLAIKLAEAALKALVIQGAMKALGMAAPGFGALFGKFSGLGGLFGGIGGGQGIKIASPAFASQDLSTPQLMTRVQGNDLLVILNRSLRTEGRIG